MVCKLLLGFLLINFIRPHSMSCSSNYLTLFSSEMIAGDTVETCVVFSNLKANVDLKIFLNLLKEIHILNESQVTQRATFHCFSFQVPKVKRDVVGNITITGRSPDYTFYSSKLVYIRVLPSIVFIDTDRPLYKPGDTVKFRVVSVDAKLLPVDQKYSTIILQNSAGNYIAQWNNISGNGGILDLKFDLSPDPPLGVYLVKVTTADTNQSTSHRFTVKEYVLPKFEIEVTAPNAVTILDKDFSIKICGRYTYGNPVHATSLMSICRNYYIYGFFRRNWKPVPPPICLSLPGETDSVGCVSHVVSLETFNMLAVNMEKSFDISVDFIERSAGRMIQKKINVRITNQVTTLDFKNILPYYRPGVPYTATVLLGGSDELPVTGQTVILYVTLGVSLRMFQFLNKTDSNGKAMFTLNTEAWGLEDVYLSAHTAAEARSVVYGRESAVWGSAQLLVLAFHSPGRTFVQIRRESASPWPCGGGGPQVTVDYTHRQTLHKSGPLYYLLLARGQIQHFDQFEDKLDSGNIGHFSFPLPIKNDFSPLVQLVVFGVTLDGEVYSDTVEITLSKCFNNQVTLTFSEVKLLPKQQIDLRLQAAPFSLCGIKVVDRSVYLLEADPSITAEKVFGLLPVTALRGYRYNLEDRVPYPCLPDQHKNDRIVHDIYGAEADSYSIFKSVGLKVFTDGEIRRPIVCYQKYDRWNPLFSLHSSETSATFDKNIRNFVRSNFPETWVWELIPLKEDGQANISVETPDSMTEWIMEGFCLGDRGFGVAQPANLTVLKPLFVDLQLPFSIVRGETLHLKATVFNYLRNCVTVSVSLTNLTTFMIVSGSHSQTACVCSNLDLTFTWKVKAVELGRQDLTVQAEVIKGKAGCDTFISHDDGGLDIIRKSLLVESEGVEIVKNTNLLLCIEDGETSEQSISLTLPQNSINDSAQTTINILGNVMGLYSHRLGRLLKLPLGTGEQNMVKFAPNVYILQYLIATGQLTPDLEIIAHGFLRIGYQRQLLFAHADGSFSNFGAKDSEGSTWLTAFVLKSFSRAQPHIYIDARILDQGYRWLLRQQNSSTGHFQNLGKVINSHIQGGVNGNVALTAYITASLLEANYTDLDRMINKAFLFLRSVYLREDDPYTIALLFYTFSLAGDARAVSHLKDILLSSAIKGETTTHWELHKDSLWSFTEAVDIEITAYVLLGLLVKPSPENLGLSFSIMQWLISQLNPYGGFRSTQDTVVGLQAVTGFIGVMDPVVGQRDIRVTAPGGEDVREFMVDAKNQLVLQQHTVSRVTGNYSLHVEGGHGCVFSQFVLKYNIQPEKQGKGAFVLETFTACDREIYLQINFTIRSIVEERTPIMSILDVKIISGYVIEETSLKQLLNNKNVEKYEGVDDHIIIYINSVSELTLHGSLTCEKSFDVENASPALIKIFQYYEPDKFATDVYTDMCAKILQEPKGKYSK